MPRKLKYQELTAEIMATLDIAAEYRAFGVEITGDVPSERGWLQCRAFGRKDSNPSAAINAQSGRYRDLGGDGDSLSLFDFAAKHGFFVDWKTARDHFAAKAGVQLDGVKDPADKLDWRQWIDPLIGSWCLQKPGVTIDAVKAAGGRLAHYGRETVLTVPIYGPYLTDHNPTGYVAWNITGEPLLAFHGKGRSPTEVKMKTIEGSQGGLIGRHALERLAGDAADSDITIWKVEGPTDLFALWAAIPPEQRERHLVVTNSGGSQEIPQPEIVAVFAGRRVFVVHDADKPGERGADRWTTAIAKVAADVRNVKLPFEVADTHGKDVRDFLNGGATFDELLRLAETTLSFATAGVEVEEVKPAPISNVEVVNSNGIEVVLPLQMKELVESVFARTDGWPRRADRELFTDHIADGIYWLDAPAALFAWLQLQTGVVDWRYQSGAATKEEFFNALKQKATRYVAIEYLPHEPAFPKHYYSCPPVRQGDGRALEALLDRFTPATDVDRQLMQAMFATLVWGGPYGCRPAFVIHSDDGSGSGKSKLVDMLAHLGKGILDLDQDLSSHDMRKRLLSPEALSRRVVRFDNVKTWKLSWALLESLITEPLISGHMMYVGDRVRPNTIVWTITMNATSLGRDMSQRAVVIKVRRPAYAGDWEQETLAYIDERREDILADLVAFLKRPASTLTHRVRWAPWERGVVARLHDPQAVQKLIAERAGDIDVDAEEDDLVVSYIRRQIGKLGYDVDQESVWIPSDIAGKWHSEATGDRRNYIGGCRILAQMANERRTTRLRRHRDTSMRGFVWIGASTLPPKMDLRERYERGLFSYANAEPAWRSHAT